MANDTEYLFRELFIMFIFFSFQSLKFFTYLLKNEFLSYYQDLLELTPQKMSFSS